MRTIYCRYILLLQQNFETQSSFQPFPRANELILQKEKERKDIRNAAMFHLKPMHESSNL